MTSILTHILHEIRTLVLVIVGSAMAIVGAKMHDEVIRTLGAGIIVSALGMAFPGMQRDPHARTRVSDLQGEYKEGKISGR